MKMRDAITTDITKLEQVKEPAVLHEDRIRDAAGGDFRYLVLEDDSAEILGHACLVFRRPKTWPSDEEGTLYPRIIDLIIHKDRRGQGLGREFMARMESACREKKYGRLYLSVNPENNVNALNFYLTLGYKALHEEPRWQKWSFKDSKGNVHHGEGLDLEMFKEIV